MHDGNHRGEEATEETTSAPLAAIAPVITSSSGGRARPARIKVVSLGDAGVGKSCLIKRHCEGKFVARYVPTIGVDYGVKPLQLGGHEVRV
jgi:DnaJ family protein C protein 27